MSIADEESCSLRNAGMRSSWSVDRVLRVTSKPEMQNADPFSAHRGREGPLVPYLRSLVSLTAVPRSVHGELLRLITCRPYSPFSVGPGPTLQS